MTAPDGAAPLRVVVCGTKFGQVYLQTFDRQRPGLSLVGILARGSGRSKACADHYGVPLFTDLDQLSDEVDAACVVVRGGLLGGPGAQLAQALAARGVHVLQEHPLHSDELGACLRTAARHGTVYQLNSFYVHTAPVRRFIAAARRLLQLQEPLYVDAACGFQVAYALLDIICSALGRVRPWGFVAPAAAGDELRRLTPLRAPFRSLEGVIGGVPLTLRVQNQMDPADPDNYAHLLHRVTIGTEGGNLTLVGTHGPTVWSPRPDFPHGVRSDDGTPHYAGDRPDGSTAHLDLPSVGPLGPASAPSYREVFASVWPDGVARALTGLRTAVHSGERSPAAGQFHLALCRIWQDITARLGPPELVRDASARPLGPDALRTVAEAGQHAESVP